MRKRIFDMKSIRRIKKEIVSQEEVDKIRIEAAGARAIMEDPKFQFLREYLKGYQEDIKEIYARQSIYDVTEEHKVGEVIRKLFFPAKKEYSMLAGEYRFIDTLVSFLKTAIEIEEKMNAKIKTEEIEVKDAE